MNTNHHACTAVELSSVRNRHVRTVKIRLGLRLHQCHVNIDCMLGTCLRRSLIVGYHSNPSLAHHTMRERELKELYKSCAVVCTRPSVEYTFQIVMEGHQRTYLPEMRCSAVFYVFSPGQHLCRTVEPSVWEMSLEVIQSTQALRLEIIWVMEENRTSATTLFRILQQ